MNTNEQLLKIITPIKKIIDAISTAGGTPYLVGGTVRDLILGAKSKDIDIEVHGMSVDALEPVLNQFGSVSLIGKQFGVLKVHGLDIDWSLPRRDSKGRKPQVVIDETMTIEAALRRRDVTMNAMAIDLSKDFVIVDPYGGQEDIEKKQLRAVDAKLFLDDPLRFYRVMQFVGRFAMQPDAELTKICQTMDVTTVSAGGELARERIYEEIKKLLLKSLRPSFGFRWLQDLGRLSELFAEVGDLVGVQQREDYHPEGDVFEHTMQALDAAARYDGYEADDEKFMIMLGVLCHDFGKVHTIDKAGKAKGHDVVGVPIAKTFLRRITNDTFLTRAVCKLVRYHRAPVTFVAQGAKASAYKRLAVKLAPEITIVQLHIVSLCDLLGRNHSGNEPLKKLSAQDDKIHRAFLHVVNEAQVERGPEPPVLLGRHLLDDVSQGAELGQLVKKAYRIQIEEGVTDLEELKKRVLR